MSIEIERNFVSVRNGGGGHETIHNASQPTASLHSGPAPARRDVTESRLVGTRGRRGRTRGFAFKPIGAEQRACRSSTLWNLVPELRSAQPDRVSSARLSALTVSLDLEEPTIRATGRDDSSTRSCHRVQVRSILDAAQPDVSLEFDSDKRNIRAGLRILRGESHFMERKKERKKRADCCL